MNLKVKEIVQAGATIAADANEREHTSSHYACGGQMHDGTMDGQLSQGDMLTGVFGGNGMPSYVPLHLWTKVRQ